VGGEMVSRSTEVEPSTEFKTGFQAAADIHTLTHFIWNKKELPDKWKSPSLYKFKGRARELSVVIIEEYSKPSLIRLELIQMEI
jgi:hypothetical protein